MNKQSKKIKLLSILLVVLLNLSTLAAIVSDNDGSVFVTKSEFESLKDDFANQILQYNDSIDNKIDGSIAAYLAGVNLQKPIIEPIINSSWKDITSINGVLSNTYIVPDIDLLFTMMYYLKMGGISNRTSDNDTDIRDTNEYWGTFHHVMRLSNESNWTTKNQYRNLVSCTGDYTDVKDLIWNGRAIKYCETINVARAVTTWTGSTRSISWLGYYDRPDSHSYALTIRNVSTFKPNGYIESWKDVSTTSWPIQYYWVYDGSNSSTISWTSDKQHESFNASIELKTDSNGNTKDYEHIINYKGNSVWRVSDTKFTKFFRQAADSTIKSSSLYSTATKVNSAKGSSAAPYPAFGSYSATATANRTSVPNFYGIRPVTHQINDDAIVSSVGMLQSDYAASDIYQDNVRSTIEVGNLKVDKDRPKLNEGFQLLAAKDGDKITWEPEFSYTHVHNGTSTYVDNSHEVDIYFSNGPFSDDTTTTKKIKVKVDGDKTEKDYATTTDRKCKVEFDMPKDGIVYVKWVPHFTGTSYLDSDWIVKLDLSKCNSYTYVRE